MKNIKIFISLILLAQSSSLISAPGDIYSGFESPTLIEPLNLPYPFYGVGTRTDSNSQGITFFYSYTGIGGINYADGAIVNVPLSFDSNTGSVRSDFQFATLYDDINDVEELEDGSFLVSGRRGGEDRFISKFRADGSLDESFNTIRLFSARFIQSLPDGKFLLVGARDFFEDSFKIKRYFADGTLDNSYQHTEFDGTIFSVSFDSAGRLYASGYFHHVNGSWAPGLARLSLDGALDDSFQPYFYQQENAVSRLRTVAVLDNDDIIVSGRFTYSREGQRRHERVIKLNASAELNEAFLNASESALTEIGLWSSAHIRAMDVDQDGKITLAGNLLARLNSDGTLDQGFAVNWFNQETFSIETLFSGEHFIPGIREVNNSPVNGIAKFDTSGALIESFNPPVTGISVQPEDIYVQEDGAIWLTGQFNTANGVSVPKVVKLDADGSVSSTQPEIADLFEPSPHGGAWTDIVPLSDGSLMMEVPGILTGDDPSFQFPGQKLLKLYTTGNIEEIADEDIALESAIPFNTGFITSSITTIDTIEESYQLQFVYSEEGEPLNYIVIGSDNDVSYIQDDIRFTSSARPLLQDHMGGLLYFYVDSNGQASIRRLLSFDGGYIIDLGFGSIDIALDVFPLTTSSLEEDIVSQSARWEFNTVPSVVKLPNDTYLLAGKFSSANEHLSDGLVAFDLSGTVDTNKSLELSPIWRSGHIPYISSLDIDSEGRIFIAGEFSAGLGLNGIACLNEDWTINRDFSPRVEYQFLMQRYFPKVYPEIVVADDRIHLTGPYNEKGTTTPKSYWQLETFASSLLTVGSWKEHPILGWVFGVTEDVGYTYNMGYIHLGNWPFVYLYDNGWGWFQYVQEGPQDWYYLYNQDMGWVLYRPDYGGWFMASNYNWQWFSFANANPGAPAE